MIYRSKRIYKDTYIIKGLMVYSYLLIGRDRALLIDTGFSYGNLRKKVNKLTKLPVTVVNTHGHIDHIGCNYLFDNMYLSRHDVEVFNAHNDPKYKKKLILEVAYWAYFLLRPFLKPFFREHPLPDMTLIDDGYIFDLGGRNVKVIATPGHTPGSICLLDIENRALFTGDTLSEVGILLHLDYCCTPEVYYESVKRIKSLDSEYDRNYPAHHGYPLDKAIVDEYLVCADGVVNHTLPYGKGGQLNSSISCRYKRAMIDFKE